MGLSIGAMALVARRIGERDPDGASRAAGQSILLGLASPSGSRCSRRPARKPFSA
jgi:Na+-driven multidrug efflux pump